MRSWLPPLREGAEPSPVHPPGRCQVLHTAMAGMGATISLGTGLSCLADRCVPAQPLSSVVRECPQYRFNSSIGHATGTPYLKDHLDATRRMTALCGSNAVGLIQS